MEKTLYIDIILPLPLNSLFTYSVPKGMEQEAEGGCRLLVPVGESKLTGGLSVRRRDRKPDFGVKESERVLD